MISVRHFFPYKIIPQGLFLGGGGEKTFWNIIQLNYLLNYIFPIKNII